ncbi:MAG: pyridoxal phosphate-dependent aminotransferase [Armatimonadota bacterium]|nr:pyridoxal phosphate-dependent aminotransferase [Armatimonadota bacterium]MDR7484725.1 pyridoxal phosphate-dependent aminotransferase [Armatimonadota bacterium]MDR7531840.1 pyridoxal phosphate-dependent aminotransferase [Armatimonadota bacterium]MDR7534815.1 pyridoxal phosphate-dependent aminotransferase [Armatimonadota bacterium]
MTPSSVLAARLTDRVVFDALLRDSEVFLTVGGGDVIQLSVGDPDLPTPAHILEAARAALRPGLLRYTHWQGLPELRAAIAEALARDVGVRYAAEEIVVTAGAEQALFVTLLALVGPGDEVVFADPYFHALPRLVGIAGGVSVPVPTEEADGFVLRPEVVERHLGPRAKVLVVVSPSNPTGAVLPRDVVEGLADVARRRDLLVVSDEVYARILYDDARHHSIASLPGMRERTVLVGGFSKTYSMTGFRLGYLAAPADVVVGLHSLKEPMDICASAVAQRAGLAALAGPHDFLRDYLAAYDARRRILMAGLDAAGISYARPAGGFFLFADVARFGLRSVEFCRRLIAEARVVVFPGTMASTREGYVRMSWLQPEERLREGLARLRAFVERLAQESPAREGTPP